jgi:hypothetical protein
MRLGWGVLGLAGLLLGLAGCTVPDGGATGVGVDAQGRPVIYIQMCKGHIDGATLYRSDDDPAKEQTLGQWEVSPAVDGFSQFILRAPTNGWRATRQLAQRDPATEYTMFGGSKDNSFASTHLDFSQNSLADLKPGEVRYPDFDSDDYDLKTGSVADFQKETCEQNWG